jgi:60 kDa SS-A/Ro ribonucleoprotein
VRDPLATLALPGLRVAVGTPQTAPADERQQPNHAGGYTFVLDELGRLRRFLTLGTAGGTYYVGERELTRANADVLLDLVRTRGMDVVAEILAVNTSGRAPKADPAIFALAAVTGLADDEARAFALKVLPQVARTGSHLLTFARYVEMFRGWGRGLRRAVAGWYEGKDADALAYQVVKYRSRADWTHRDLLRLAHPEAPTAQHGEVYDFLCGRRVGGGAPLLLDEFAHLQAATTPREVVRIVEGAGGRISWEMIPSELLNSGDVWAALLAQGVPQTALMRQLPRLTRLGITSSHGRQIAAQLADPERLRKARVHPINVLVALRTYASGRSARGAGEWTPSQRIVDALDAAFYAAFGAVEASGKRTRLALDVSGSMVSPIAGMPLSCREASAALAMVTAATEPDHDVVGFTSGGRYGGWSSYGRRSELTPLDVSPRRRLDDNIRAVSNLPFGGTDCALPITDALARGLEFDTFAVYTDNETYAGSVHPHEALARYRAETGIPARLVVVGMTATHVTIADPTDPGMLDVAGFDAAVPSLVSDFSAGRL